MWYTIREDIRWIVRSAGSGCGIIPVDQLVSIADNDLVGEIEDVVALIVTPAPEHKNWLIHVYLQLLLLAAAGKSTCYGLLEANSVAELVIRSVAGCAIWPDDPYRPLLITCVRDDVCGAPVPAGGLLVPDSEQFADHGDHQLAGGHVRPGCRLDEVEPVHP
ncbi:MAG: hypothetical protein ACRDRW_13110, partial [Pseudonocardiaceae bacterium]